MTRRPLIAMSSLLLMAGAAEAHTGAGVTHGFSHGFMHPIGGMDHILAMVAVGLFAAHLGGRAIWMVPMAFMSMMAAGGLLGIAGVPVPFIELGIAASVLVLGAIVALQWSPPVLIAMSIVGFFAVFHGYAHGAEMPESAGGLAYAAGFVLATGLLHALGIGLGFGTERLSRLSGRRVAQLGGGAMAVVGLAMLGGSI